MHISIYILCIYIYYMHIIVCICKNGAMSVQEMGWAKMYGPCMEVPRKGHEGCVSAFTRTILRHFPTKRNPFSTHPRDSKRISPQTHWLNHVFQQEVAGFILEVATTGPRPFPKKEPRRSDRSATFKCAGLWKSGPTKL